MVSEELHLRGGEASLARGSERVFGSVSDVAGKFDSDGASPLRPSCSSSKVWRDGLRGEVQRWLCRSCGYRFSGSKTLKSGGAIVATRQICVSETKNLGPVAEIKTVTGGIKRRKPFGNGGTKSNLEFISEEARGLITEFMAYLEREGFDEDIQYPTTLSHLVKDGANLLDPENVKQVIAKQRKKNGEPWSDSMKMLACCAYDAFCRMKKIQWNRPIYHQNEITMDVPDEKDLDLLISRGRKKMAAFLRCLKETFADPLEIIKCEWTDLRGNVLSINHPVKGHLPGKVELTPQLTRMLNALPRKKKCIFATTYKTLYASFYNLRAKAAAEFQNEALLKISFKSFRHWGGSLVAELSNGNTLTIMRVLRHKSFKSSMRYIHTINFKEEDYETTTATTPEEILALGKAGWTKYDEITVAGVQIHFYRKPKRFESFGGFKKAGVENRVDKSEKRVDRFLCTA